MFNTVEDEKDLFDVFLIECRNFVGGNTGYEILPGEIMIIQIGFCFL